MNGLLTFEIKDGHGFSHENFKVNFEKVTNQFKKKFKLHEVKSC